MTRETCRWTSCRSAKPTSWEDLRDAVLEQAQTHLVDTCPRSRSRRIGGTSRGMPRSVGCIPAALTLTHAEVTAFRDFPRRQGGRAFHARPRLEYGFPPTMRACPRVGIHPLGQPVLHAPNEGLQLVGPVTAFWQCPPRFDDVYSPTTSLPAKNYPTTRSQGPHVIERSARGGASSTECYRCLI